MPSNPYLWHLEDDIFCHKVTDFVTKYLEYDQKCHIYREYLTYSQGNEVAHEVHVYKCPEGASDEQQGKAPL
jgi:hypothetical protein